MYRLWRLFTDARGWAHLGIWPVDMFLLVERGLCTTQFASNLLSEVIESFNVGLSALRLFIDATRCRREIPHEPWEPPTHIHWGPPASWFPILYRRRIWGFFRALNKPLPDCTYQFWTRCHTLEGRLPIESQNFHRGKGRGGDADPLGAVCFFEIMGWRSDVTKVAGERGPHPRYKPCENG